MISVAMASYNGEKYIYEQLQSIWYQTVRPDEIVISDDASSDTTVQIIKKFINETDAPIRLICNKTRNGYIKNFIIALSHISGEIIFLSDQDDIWHKKKVEICTACLQQNLFITALSTDFFLINSDGTVLKRPFQIPIKKSLMQIPLRRFLRHPKYPGMSMAVRKELITEMISQKNDSAAHDWQLNLLAALQGGLFYYSKPLTFYRQHSENTTGILLTKGSKQRISMLIGLKKNLDNPGNLPPDDMLYALKYKKTIETRMVLIKHKKRINLLTYDLIHLKYMSLYSIFGDMYAVIHRER